MPKFADADGKDRTANIGVCSASGGTGTAELDWISLEALPINFAAIFQLMGSSDCTLVILFQGYIEWTDVFKKSQNIWLNISCQQFDVATGKALVGQCKVQHSVLDVDAKLKELTGHGK